jgi:demethylmenaquinone methyltransferase / 2-methoxy-6-polyprenyl-1,4-benzoquinol methylase
MAASPPSNDTAAFGFKDVPRAEKAGKVKHVFDSVAADYDR